MKTVRLFLILALAVSLAAPGRAIAGQRHIVPPNEIAAATVNHATAQDEDRAVIREALSQPQVRSTVAKLGVSMDRLENAVNTMSGEDLQRAASTAREVNDQLVGGASTVTISTTAIIIALLVIILIVVAVD